MTDFRWTLRMVMPAGDGVTISRPLPAPSPPEPVALTLTDAASKAGAAGCPNAVQTVKIDRVVPNTTRIFYLCLFSEDEAADRLLGGSHATTRPAQMICRGSAKS